jgi:hypothetical protein
MNRKSVLVLIVGFMLGVGFCAVTGSTTSRGGAKMLVGSGDGLGFFYDGSDLYVVTSSGNSRKVDLTQR